MTFLKHPPENRLEPLKPFFHAVTPILETPSEDSFSVRTIEPEDLFPSMEPVLDALNTEVIGMRGNATFAPAEGEVLHFRLPDCSFNVRAYNPETNDPDVCFADSITHHLEYNYNFDGALIVTSVPNIGAGGIDFS